MQFYDLLNLIIQPFLIRCDLCRLLPNTGGALWIESFPDVVRWVFVWKVFKII